MSYSINKSNGSLLTVIPDGSLDNSTNLLLVGKNYSGYGTFQNENFVYLLENFSNPTEPSKPLIGQLWFDSATNKLKFYDSNLNWRQAAGADVSSSFPSYLTNGDFWFDTDNNQLYVYSSNGSATGSPGYVLVGPPSSAYEGSSFRARTVIDISNNKQEIIEGIVNGQTTMIVSMDDFILDANINPISGFDRIHPGITLVNTLDGTGGVTSGVDRFWGTATNAEKLGDLDAALFVQKSGTRANFLSSGVTIGDTPTVKISVSNNIGSISNIVGNTLDFQVTASSILKKPLSITSSGLIPGESGVFSIGDINHRYTTIFATSLDGTAARADKLKSYEYGTYLEAIAALPSTQTKESIVARDTAGDCTVNILTGTATRARYGDLAEKYLADRNYEPGTVVSVGGEKEITASTIGDRPIGVISTNPAYMMNMDLEGGIYVALKGRVPVKVTGPVKKGDKLVANIEGTASVALYPIDVFAIALETSTDIGIKIIEAVIL